MEAESPYTFTLPNFLKSHSMFNAGMQVGFLPSLDDKDEDAG